MSKFRLYVQCKNPCAMGISRAPALPGCSVKTQKSRLSRSAASATCAHFIRVCISEPSRNRCFAKSIWYNSAVACGHTRRGSLTSVEMTMLTKAQLRRFVKLRNRSYFPSNLQFMADCNECGFRVADLGHARPFVLDRFKGYQWTINFKTGPIRMVEFGRTLYLDQDKEAAEMFELMSRAQFIPVEEAKAS